MVVVVGGGGGGHVQCLCERLVFVHQRCMYTLSMYVCGIVGCTVTSVWIGTSCGGASD